MIFQFDFDDLTDNKQYHGPHWKHTIILSEWYSKSTRGMTSLTHYISSKSLNWSWPPCALWCQHSTFTTAHREEGVAWWRIAARAGSVCALCGRRVSLSQPKSKERNRVDHATASPLQTECRQGMYSSWKCKGAPTSRSILFKIYRPIIIWNMAEVKSRWVALLLRQLAVEWCALHSPPLASQPVGWKENG